MWGLLLVCLLPGLVLANLRPVQESKPVDFSDAQVQHQLSVLVKGAQVCVLRVNAQPNDVRAYFTNTRPKTRTGECFASCMLQQSKIIEHGKVNFDLLVYLAGLVNGKNSKVVTKLTAVARGCLNSNRGIKDKCSFAATYNNCLNDNMKEFSFPADLAEEVVRKMPFHIVKAQAEVESFIAEFLSKTTMFPDFYLEPNPQSLPEGTNTLQMNTGGSYQSNINQ